MEMKMYKFVNIRTKPFGKISFSGQNEYFVLVDIVEASKPSVILGTEPIFRKENAKLIKQVRDFELYGIPLPDSLQRPIYGSFINVNSSIPLKKYYTEDDVRTGLCALADIGKCIEDSNSNPKVFKIIKVFCKLTFDNENYLFTYTKEWNPIQRAKWKYKWCYDNINDEEGMPSFYL